MRIAYLADPGTGNGFYRGTGPMTALAQCRGHQVRALPTNEARPPVAEVRDLDVLHIHRYCDARAQLLAREAKEHGAAVVWDNDDDISAVPKGSGAYKFFGGLQGEKRLVEMRKIFRFVDLVTAPNPTLAERLGTLGAVETDVVENHVPDQFLEARGRPREGVTIGWIAGLEHQLDVERLPLREGLQALLDERPDVHVTTFGLGLGLRSRRYHHVDVVPLLQLAQEAAAFDIGIAPIADIPLNQARSNIKLKEYAAASVPWLASPIGPYVGMGEKQGGRLVADDRWGQELRRLLDKPRERRKLAKRAFKWAGEETLSKHAGEWEVRFAHAIERTRAVTA